MTKNGRIYGVLTPATAPRPVTIPDRDRAGANAEAVRRFHEQNPDASLDELVVYTASLGDEADSAVEWNPEAIPFEFE